MTLNLRLLCGRGGADANHPDVCGSADGAGPSRVLLRGERGWRRHRSRGRKRCCRRAASSVLKERPGHAAPASSRAAEPPPTSRSSSISSASSPPRPATRARSARRAVRNPSTPMSAAVGQGLVAASPPLSAVACWRDVSGRNGAAPRDKPSLPCVAGASAVGVAVAGSPFSRGAHGTRSRCEVSNECGSTRPGGALAFSWAR